MGNVAGVSLIFWLLVCVVCFVNRNDFATPLDLTPATLIEPEQSKIETAPFNVQLNEVDYRVEPLFDYVITGVVVSYRHHSGESMLHEMWNDHLNMADLCIVWSANASNPLINEIEFWNGQFTCNIHYQTDVIGNSFNMTQLSNNHLISEDPWIRKAIKKVKVGDQVKISGWLVNYSNNLGSKRGTSTVRTDRGNGACETIYVKSFDIVKTMPSKWRTWMWVSLVLSGLSLIGYFLAPHRVR